MRRFWRGKKRCVAGSSRPVVVIKRCLKNVHDDEDDAQVSTEEEPRNAWELWVEARGFTTS